MKKSVKIILIILLFAFVAIISFTTYSLILVSGVKIDDKKLINLSGGYVFYDKNGKISKEYSDNKEITEFKNIPKNLVNAFIATEDKRFYKHNGIDVKGVFRATFNNIKSFSLKEGASTISQQLIKNTHLSSEKTIKRKLLEFKLALDLEKKYSKNEILEKYLNTIYFGENCYGISSASKHYFNKIPEDLTLNECAALAGLVKAPSAYSPANNTEKFNSRKNVVLKSMLEQKYITAKEYDNCVKTEVQTTNSTRLKENYFDLAEKNAAKILERYPLSAYQKINVYTYYDDKIQECVIQNFNICEECNKTVTLCDKNNNICAYASDIPDQKRSVGSTIKPILVYAPAIEENVVYPCSKILDEKINIGGYTPSNYNDKYYGYVSVKKSLEKSLNSCAVKLLNYTGIEKSIEYAKKTGVEFTDDDNNLAIALGATQTGSTLSEITSAYNVFLNKGTHKKQSIISKITINGQIVYQNKQESTNVFGEDTTYIINNMTKSVVKEGTAKKLSFLDFPLCAKTGTVGNKQGNTDAYCISYNPDYVIGVRFSQKSDKMLNNDITGGTYPASLSYNIWKDLSSQNEFKDFDNCEKVIKLKIDRTKYEQENEVYIANEHSSEKDKIEQLFKTSYIPPQLSVYDFNNFEKPKMTVFNNRIEFNLCLTESQEIKIFKIFGKEKALVYDSFVNSGRNKFIDNDVTENEVYEYSYIPYYIENGKEILGTEIVLGKIKSSEISTDDWWIYD